MRIRLRYLLRERDVRGQVDERVLSVYRDHGVVPKDSRTDNFNKTPENVALYKLVLEGDVVVNKMKAWQGSVAVSEYRGIVSADYLVCEVVGDVDPRFLHYLLRSSPMIGEYRTRSTGIRPSQWRLYWDDMADIVVDIPSKPKQRAIATFLDSEALRIDSLTSGRERMLMLLEERVDSQILQEVGASSIADLPNGVKALQVKRVLNRVVRTSSGSEEMITAYRDGQVTARSMR